MDLVTMLDALDRLTISKKPVWGKMTAQEMVEHLSDLLIISRGVKKFTLNENDETIARRQQFLYSDKEMARNIAIPFRKDIIELRHNELALSIDEFTIEWLNFIEYYEENPGATETHPYYGALDFEKWMKLHVKHFKHHFQQFELI
jgi:hydroxymethylglutaryl-CoA reductase